MKKRFPPIALLLALLAALFFGLIAAADAPDHVWHTFDRLDGFDADQVFDIAQMADGSLWFATDNGVFRYDGSWQHLTAGVAPGETHALLVVDGEMWAGGGQGIRRWQDDAWVQEGAGTQLAADSINDLLAMPDGTVLAAGDANVYLWSQNQGWRRLSGVPVTGADCLALDAHHTVWLSRAERLFRFASGQWQEMTPADTEDPAGFEITDLLADSAGGLWAATAGRGIVHLQDGQLAWENIATGLPTDAINALALDEEDRLWAATNGAGVARLGPDGWRQLDMADGLVSDTVTALMQDRAGMFWFGTEAGLSCYDARTWRTWPDAPQAPHRRINALTTAADGVLWAGAADGGLYALQGDGWRQVSLQVNQRPITLSAIETLYPDDSTGGLWIGTSENGALFLESDSARQLTAADGLASNHVTAIARTSDGAVWFGTAASGLSRWDGQTWRTFTRQDGLGSDEITALLALSDGSLLVGARAGLWRYDQGAWQPLDGPNSPGAVEITAMVQDEAGVVWIGTRGAGVIRMLDGMMQTLDTGSGLLSMDVEDLLATHGRLYVASPAGFTVHDGRTWQHFSPAYGYDLGPVFALAATGASQIYLGGENGVIRYAPDTSSPAIKVISVNGRLPHDGVVTVPANDRVQIQLQGQDTLTLSDELLYLHQLDGVDNGWQQSRTGSVIYPALASGDYRFQAQVRDVNMNYSLPVEFTLRVRRATAFIWLPGMIGHVRPEFALFGIIFITLLMAVIGYASWSAAVRWHGRNQAVGRRFNPYIAGTPVRSADMFFGRDELLQTVEASLAHNSLMIYGERRIGKTSLLYRLLDDLRNLKDEQFKFFPVFVDLEGTQEAEFFHHLMEGLLDALQDELTDFPAHKKLQYFIIADRVDYTDRHTRRDLRQIISYLKKKYDKTPRIIFLLDEADVLSSYSSLTQQQFRRILQDVFARNLGVVISGVHISKAWDRVESPWYNMFVEVVVPPLNRQESERLMRGPVAGVYEWDDEAIRFIWHRSHGRPHRIQQVAHEAVNIMLDDQRRRITLSDVRQAYERIVFAEAA